MKIPALLVSLVTLACASTSRLAAAEAPALGCPVGLDWAGGFVNLSRPVTPFPTQDTALTNSPDCVFHQWSWEAFVWATAPSSNGVLRFMNLRTEDEFKLSATAARPHPGKLVLKPRALKPPTMSRKVARAKALSLTGSAENVDEFLQASGGVLVDTNGNAVYYTVNMNDTYFNFARKYVGSNGYNTASASLNFPVGSAVFKSAWQVVPPGQTAAYKSNFYVTAASVPMLTNIWVSGTNAGVATVPGKTRDVTVALVGLHVVGVTTNHAEFVWGTFEQVSNAPYLPPGMSPTSTQAVSSNNATFYQAGTSALNCNGNVYSSGFSVPPPTLQSYASQTFTPTNNVFLRHRYGGSNAENAYDIENLNKVSQAELVKLKSIFSNYALVGTVWMAPNSLSTNSSNINTFGSTNLANSVMETFVQGSRLTPSYANCFVCHSPQPKNINISHVVYFP